MDAPTEAYPLTWPQGWKRTEPHRRQRAKFHSTSREFGSGGGSWLKKRDLTMAESVDRVRAELQRMGARSLVISTNVRVRLDGLPRSGERQPDDPGTAVYWTTSKGEKRCMAVDQYDRVADNLAAIAGTLAALRAVERYGGATILDRAFTGFVALPPPMDTRTWLQVLGLEPGRTFTRAELDAAYRSKRSAAHPDKGGSASEFNAVQTAYDQAKRELGIEA